MFQRAEREYGQCVYSRPTRLFYRNEKQAKNRNIGGQLQYTKRDVQHHIYAEETARLMRLYPIQRSPFRE